MKPAGYLRSMPEGLLERFKIIREYFRPSAGPLGARRTDESDRVLSVRRLDEADSGPPPDPKGRGLFVPARVARRLRPLGSRPPRFPGGRENTSAEKFTGYLNAL